jgi:hypothetical protein
MQVVNVRETPSPIEPVDPLFYKSNIREKKKKEEKPDPRT